MLSAAEFRRTSTACIHFAELDDVSLLMSDDVVSVVFVRAERGNRGLLNGLAESLQFADYFGANWDAFEESLGDLPEDKAMVVCIRDSRSLWRDVPRECATLIETWLAVVESRGKDAAGLHLVFVW